MRALCRASNPIRKQLCCIPSSHTYYAKCEAYSNLENGQHQHSKEHHSNRGFHSKRPISPGVFHPPVALIVGRSLSCQVRADYSDKDDDLEDGFSDLDVPPKSDMPEELLNKEDESESGGDKSSENVDESAELAPGLFDNEADYGEKHLGKKGHSSPLFQVIMDSPRPSLNNALDKWVEVGNCLGRGEISLAVLNLRKRQLYGKALQFLEWLEANKHIELGERDYASRLDLVAKVQGLQKAEKYIEKIPQSLRGEIIYRTLLANCVTAANLKKSEEVFNKIKDRGFPITTFACNQLLLLYKRVNRKKIGDVLKMMEKEDVKPSLFTYKLLVDTKGCIHDTQGMEDVITAMKAEGLEPDFSLQALVAKHYIFAGHKKKSEATLKEMEGDDICTNRNACKSLLPLYAALGKADDVERIWKVCEHNPRLEECSAAIELGQVGQAWGKLGKVEDAEKVFEKMNKLFKKLSSKYYNVLLKVYADHKLLSKGKELVKRMADGGCKIGPLTWDALVKLYVEAGEVEKADSILQKASEQNQIKPLYSTHIYLLEKYAERGDVHKAEKIFHSLREIGYAGRMRKYQLLLQAYINAKAPAYGFRERLKADNILVNKGFFAQLHAVDAFRKSPISELLE
ncbi:LOW QUALITY PROTEIN: pentatricopeptide repeat-containing protein At1g80270, mitochondrial-like [Phalaenopsis equestris]|uniref:LOW QUALITY PROTEIN: pentatricopeptide repeat-containing protein At1g80270, mitochondrial-like n=1 Tax=Phalaenopsis equestris TaxID=78828 RepID=UPI0009E60C0A|nr:LOW QUALITY PROTEIN: pentatricopeptide repeat-containing protein At1g80270, mitochondrial-like [Phalaenopsis equestris]